MSPNLPPRSFRWKRLLQALGVLLLLGMIGTAYSVHRLVNHTIPESYAAWTTGDLLVEYLQTHSNQWPRSWEDLRAANNSRRAKGLSVHTPIDQLPKHVKIDWSVDFSALTASTRSGTNLPLRMVTNKEGGRLMAAWGADTEPNSKVIRYAQSLPQ